MIESVIFGIPGGSSSTSPEDEVLGSQIIAFEDASVVSDDHVPCFPPVHVEYTAYLDSTVESLCGCNLLSNARIS